MYWEDQTEGKRKVETTISTFGKGELKGGRGKAGWN